MRFESETMDGAHAIYDIVSKVAMEHGAKRVRVSMRKRDDVFIVDATLKGCPRDAAEKIENELTKRFKKAEVKDA